MKDIVKPPENHDKMVCPDCHSHNVHLVEENEVMNHKNEKLKSYKCLDCEATFIPAIDDGSHQHKRIEEWANKVKLHEGLGQDKKWRKEDSGYIIIRNKKKK